MLLKNTLPKLLKVLEDMHLSQQTANWQLFYSMHVLSLDWGHACVLAGKEVNQNISIQEFHPSCYVLDKNFPSLSNLVLVI